jgi:hypothetical protein
MEFWSYFTNLNSISLILTTGYVRNNLLSNWNLVKFRKVKATHKYGVDDFRSVVYTYITLFDSSSVREEESNKFER